MQSTRKKEREDDLNAEIQGCENKITSSMEEILHIYKQGPGDKTLNLVLSLPDCLPSGQKFPLREKEKALALYAWAQEQKNPQILERLENIKNENNKRADATRKKAQSYYNEIEEIRYRITQIDEEAELEKKEQSENIKRVKKFLQRVFDRTDFFKDEKLPTDPIKIVEKAKAYTKACPRRNSLLEFHLSKVKELIITIAGLAHEKNELEKRITLLQIEVRKLGFHANEDIIVKEDAFTTSPADDHKGALTHSGKEKDELKALSAKGEKLKISSQASKGKTINPEASKTKEIEPIVTTIQIKLFSRIPERKPKNEKIEKENKQSSHSPMGLRKPGNK